MLQRNDTGAEAKFPTLDPPASAHAGQVIDYPSLLDGFTAVRSAGEDGPVVTVVAEPDPDDLDSLKKPALIALAEQHGLDSSGTVADLIARLRAPAEPDPDPDLDDLTKENV